MAKIKVPTRNEIDEQDYTLGEDPNWVENFGGEAREIGNTAGQQGNAFRGDAEYQQRQIQQREAPTTDFTGANRALTGSQRGAAGQGQVFDELMNFAGGPQGPSGAQAAIRQGANQSMAQNLSLARAGSGFGEDAAGLADAQRSNVTAMQGASNAAAQTAADEDQAFQARKLQAFGMGGDVAGAQRAGAVNEAEARAGMSQFDTTSQLTAEQQRDAAAQGWFGAGVDAFGQGTNANLAARELELGGQEAALGGRVDQGSAEAERYATDTAVFKERLRRDEAQRQARRDDRSEGAKLVGTTAGAIAAVVSDERAKTKITRHDRGTALERVGSREGDSGGGGSAGRAKRDYETYQYGGGLDDMRSRYDELAEPDAKSEKPGAGMRLAKYLGGSLSDRRAKTSIRSYY